MSTKKILKIILIVLSALITVTQAIDEMDLLTDDEAEEPP